MAKAIGLTGFTGVGKSTAASMLSSARGAKTFYFGELVPEELKRRGLQRTAEREKEIRLELRRNDPVVFPRHYIEEIRQEISGGGIAVLDAVMSVEEEAFLRREISEFVLVHLKSSLEIRAERLSHRTGRTSTRLQIEERDSFEIEVLSINRVFARAETSIENDASLDMLAARLSDL